MIRFLALLGLAALIATPSSGQSEPPFALETFAEGLSAPVFVTAPRGDVRLFVVEQTGAIRVFAADGKEGDIFLDLSGEIVAGGEQGLLGLAFHPEFSANGRLFVNYTDRSGDTRIVEYQASGAAAEPGSARELLAIDQPAQNHNGGWLGFGPDGYLYIGTGDGGASGDRFGNGQNRDTLLGALLRLDVDGAEKPYAIPAENPFARGGGAPEIFAFGLRNPWRVAFDGDDIYIADVGQNALEEVSVITTADTGANLGWNTMEGDACFSPASGCDTSGLVMPVHVYSHGEGCSITGGYVYRGAAIPEIEGHYFYADYCAGWLKSVRYAEGAITEETDWSEAVGGLGNVTSFGQDDAGELYITIADGKVLKLTPR